jgi:hypothetical protein
MHAPSTVIVTVGVIVERERLVRTGFGVVPCLVDVERELRAEVSFHGVHAEPQVIRLDKAEWEELTTEEQQGAEEAAAELAWDQLLNRIRRAS